MRQNDEPSDPEEFAVHYQQMAHDLQAKLTAAETRLREADEIIADLLGDNLGDANPGDAWYLYETRARQWRK